MVQVETSVHKLDEPAAAAGIASDPATLRQTLKVCDRVLAVAEPREPWLALRALLQEQRTGPAGDGIGPAAGRLAAELAEPAQLDRLDELVTRMAVVASTPPFDDYRRADIRFHIGIAEAAASPRLISEMTEVQGQVSDLITLIAHPPEVLLHSNEQHRKMVWLLRRKDSLRAVQVMREHIEGTEHILAGLI